MRFPETSVLGSLAGKPFRHDLRGFVRFTLN
jgi:hypothetical protein